MRRLVFSRKGFDSAYGGVPSPILPDGRLVSLPIPEPSTAATGPSYKDILAPNGRTLGELMSDMSVLIPIETAAHLDPDLIAASCQRRPGWRPMCGTDDTSGSASHLESRLLPGDLILFYGWFGPAQDRKEQSRVRSEARSIHAIFGYLEVEELIRVGGRAAADALPDWMQEHPHVRDPLRRGNMLVLARAESTTMAGAPGAGAFPYLHESLVLTQPGARWYEWLLPHAFAPGGQLVPFTYRSHPSRWSVTEAGVQIDTKGIGQEYVIDCNPGVVNWAHDIVRRGLVVRRVLD